MTLKLLTGTLGSLIIPGMGQVFYGKLGWALFWLILSLGAPGSAVFCALHVVYLHITKKRQ